MENYHITHEDDRWVLREEGDKRALLEALTREDILSETRDYMKLRTASVKIHNENGAVEEERRYPRDQDPRATGGYARSRRCQRLPSATSQQARMNGMVSGGRPNWSNIRLSTAAVMLANKGASQERCTWLTASAASAGL